MRIAGRCGTRDSTDTIASQLGSDFYAPRAIPGKCQGGAGRADGRGQSGDSLMAASANAGAIYRAALVGGIAQWMTNPRGIGIRGGALPFAWAQGSRAGGMPRPTQALGPDDYFVGGFRQLEAYASGLVLGDRCGHVKGAELDSLVPRSAGVKIALSVESSAGDGVCRNLFTAAIAKNQDRRIGRGPSHRGSRTPGRGVEQSLRGIVLIAQSHVVVTLQFDQQRLCSR